MTCRVPLIASYPGITTEAYVDSQLHYHFDWAATLVELMGGQTPANWDAHPFTQAFRANQISGRDYPVLSQGAWACQRSIRFENGGRS